MPSALRQLLLGGVVNDGYGLRGKSKWVCEAVRQLVRREEWTDEMVGNYAMINDDQDVFVLDAETEDAINVAIRDAIQVYPHLKAGAQSAIIRTAINARVLRIGTLKFKPNSSHWNSSDRRLK
jgi:hypothetical protein